MVEMLAKPSQGGGTAFAEGVTERDLSNGRFVASPVGNLTEKQKAFVDFYVSNGGDAQLAAKSAGYADAKLDGWRNRNNPAVQIAIRNAQALAIQEGAAVAWKFMVEAIKDPVMPAPVRFQAAKWTLEASGHGLAAQALLAKVGGGADKPISEMSVSELEDYVKRLGSAVESAKVAEGRVVENEASASDSPA